MKLTLSKFGGAARRFGVKRPMLMISQILLGLGKDEVLIEDPESALEGIHRDTGKSALNDNEIDLSEGYDIQIIMPVYNTASTLRRAIESVLSQKGDVRFLLTIVNDGSPDNSGEILLGYSDHPDIDIITQENRGFSGARNAALQRIRGRYITFLDSDDYLPDGALNALYTKAISGDYDIVQGSYIRLEGETKTYVRSGNLLGFPWGKLFKADTFRHLCFPEGYWFEDTLLGLIIFPLSDPARQAVIDAPVYVYFINQDGITQTSRKSQKTIDTVWVTRRLLEDRKTLGKLTPADYDIFLRQARMNVSRMETYGDEDLTRLVFLTMRQMAGRYFPGATPVDPQLKPLAAALTGNSFSTFMFLTGLLA
ncbi:MAG: glycosyltransferase [Duncaniella sp.]|nr:glycosyltransferase [Duncaniella sp.]